MHLRYLSTLHFSFSQVKCISVWLLTSCRYILKLLNFLQISFHLILQYSQIVADDTLNKLFLRLLGKFQVVTWYLKYSHCVLHICYIITKFKLGFCSDILIFILFYGHFEISMNRTELNSKILQNWLQHVSIIVNHQKIKILPFLIFCFSSFLVFR